MGGARVSANRGIQVDFDNRRYLLDPREPAQGDYTFVSHAHVDHVHNPRKGEKVIASEQTRDLAAVRGYDLGETSGQVEGVDLLDSGHILGSRALRIEDEVLYTGDAGGRERAFLGRCRTKNARILIVETTFGCPEYLFPPTAKLVKEVNTLIGQLFDKGRPVVLMGYALGKAQVLTYLFSPWGPLYVHPSVAQVNEVHRNYGVELRKGMIVDPHATEHPELRQGPWIMVAPLMNGRNRFMTNLKKKHGAVLIGFSGWAVHPGYSSSLGLDFAFPLSDHCDYAELMRLVQDVSPELVYTTHGFAGEFARDLKRQGFAAKSISAYQSSLSEFLVGDLPRADILH